MEIAVMHVRIALPVYSRTELQIFPRDVGIFPLQEATIATTISYAWFEEYYENMFLFYPIKNINQIN